MRLIIQVGRSLPAATQHTRIAIAPHLSYHASLFSSRSLCIHTGSVCLVRISSNPKPSNNDIDWKVAWSREEDPAVTAGFVDGVASRIFSPSLLRSGLDVAAIEITLDTSSWTEDKWSELDCVRLVGSGRK